ncbi:hypothetical protein KDL44_12795 [bacterium]|nr:hypothetical protein [bacterium]
MKLTMILTIAVTMLCAVHSSALAEEPAKPSGEFREISPEEMEARLAGQWWRQAGEIETPSGASTEGTWLIRLEMFDESGKLLSQSELLSKSNSFASSKTKLVAGQQGVGDFTTLADYPMLLWAFPPQYDQAFRDYGHLDWPANRDGVKVTREDGTELDLSQPQLSEEQCRELFTQMLRRAAVLEYDGLRLYMFSPVASSINLHLDWTDRADEPEALPRDPREREAVIREKARPAADFTLYLNGGQWAGGDSMQAGGEWSSGGTIAGGEFAGGGDVAGTDTDGGEWAGGEG